MVGQTISHYSVIERLGAGGMGEIYKAQDTRLNRFVAIKVLSVANAGDPDRRRRFIQEAQAASALNHPNIITIYDIVSQDGMDFMVMEFVSGSTLNDLIPKEGMTVSKALGCAVQMADALGVAHAAGIIHRDLKPGNVMVTPSGLVKILDFGLAKLTGPATAVEQTDETLPLSAPMTIEGSILGTVCYMSPEQAEARRVDGRSDIFSFGLVLYEMLTGSKAFAAGSTVSTLSKILRDEARPIGQMVHGVPPELEQVVTRAMRKEPDQRWQTMQEMHAALADLKQKLDSSVLMKVPLPARKRQQMVLVVASAGVVVIGLVSGAWWWKHRRPVIPPYQPPAQVAQTAPVPPPVTAPADAGTPAAGAAPDASAPAGAAGATPPAPAPPPDNVLTNQAVYDMLQAKVPNSVIVSHIRSSKTKFDLTTSEIIRLTKGGANAELIEAMRNPRGSSSSAAARSTAPAPATSAPAPVSASPAAPPSAPASAPASNPTQPAPTVPPAAAPAAAAPAAPSASASAKGPAVTIHGGLPLSIALTEKIAPNPEPGQVLHFAVSQDFKVGDVLVIAKGTPLTGQIVEAGGNRKLLVMHTKPTFRVTQVDASDGTKLKIKASPGRRADKVDAPIEPPGQRDKEVLAPAGSQYVVYLDGDQTVTIKR